MYFRRNIDQTLFEWKSSAALKPLLLRGARQVGKSTAIRHLGKSFKFYIEVNFEKSPDLVEVFRQPGDVRAICNQLSLIFNTPVVEGDTLLFFDEVQACPNAIKSLWFFKEDMPRLHVASAGSLLEFAIKEISSFGVGRIRSMFMYPMSFFEFMEACGQSATVDAVRRSDALHPMSSVVHDRLVGNFRDFIIVGGMPASVAAWVRTSDFLECASEQQDIMQAYMDDFPKYASKVNPDVLRGVLDAVVAQVGHKFVYSRVGLDIRAEEVKKALAVLTDAGIIRPVWRTAANGLPLGAESDDRFRKYLFLDSGLMLRMLDLSPGVNSAARAILTATAADLVNKGPITEMIAGWELVKNESARVQPRLFYWENPKDGGDAEVDYLVANDNKVLPIEVKAGTSGKMKSLRLFMERKGLQRGVRTSLENFGSLQIAFPDNRNAVIDIIPLYALERLCQ